MLVQKFGGTSVGSAERIKSVANLIQQPESKSGDFISYVRNNK